MGIRSFSGVYIKVGFLCPPPPSTSQPEDADFSDGHLTPLDEVIFKTTQEGTCTAKNYISFQKKRSQKYRVLIFFH